MSEVSESEDREIVDLDHCSKKKSILIGALVAFALGLVPFSYTFLCIHYLIAGIAAAGHFAKRYAISITGMTGAKLGAASAFLGMLPILVIVLAFLFTGFGEAEFEQVREEIVKTMYEEGNPEAAEFAEKAELSQLKPVIVGVILVAGSGFSLVIGALGGLLGSSLFKKGPPAQ